MLLGRWELNVRGWERYGGGMNRYSVVEVSKSIVENVLMLGIRSVRVREVFREDGTALTVRLAPNLEGSVVVNHQA